MKAHEASSLEEYIQQHYIVMLYPEDDPHEVAAEYEDAGIEITHVFDSAINGFSAHLYEISASVLEGDPRVLSVEHDGYVEEDGAFQSDAPWHLDRISQSFPPFNDHYFYGNDARGVTVYVIDSGIRASHVEFANIEVTVGYQSDPNDPYGSEHGTGVASNLAGALCGTAKRVDLVDVSAFGSAAERIAGIEWVIENGTAPSPVNMSFGITNSSAHDTACENLVAAGFTVICSAGNDPNLDIMTRSPQKVDGTFVVAGSNINNEVYGSTTEGAKVDIIAPSRLCLRALASGDLEYTHSNGTSYGTPIVSGAAAMILAAHPNFTAEDVKAKLVADSTPDAIAGLRNPATPNRLLNTEFIGGRVYSDEATEGSITFERVEPILDVSEAAPAATAAGEARVTWPWSDPVQIEVGASNEGSVADVVPMAGDGVDASLVVASEASDAAPVAQDAANASVGVVDLGVTTALDEGAPSATDDVAGTTTVTVGISDGLPPAQDAATAEVAIPLAPTLLTPPDGTAHDGKTFTWSFNSDSEGDSQTEFAFRRTLDGVDEWWDGTQWVDTEVFLVSTDESLTLPDGAWA